MDNDFSDLLDYIEVSPVLDREQKLLLVASIEAGEPFSKELIESVMALLKAGITYENINQEDLKIRLSEIDKQILKFDNSDPKKIQKKAREIIALVDNFLAEMKRVDKKFDDEIEGVVHQEEGEEANAIRAFLKKSKKKE